MGTFDYSPMNLLAECDSHIAHLQKHLQSHKELRMTYMGSYYRSDLRPAKESPENYPFSFVANVKPKIAFENPRVKTQSANASVDSTQCAHTGRAINQWIRQQNLMDVLDPAATDFLLTWTCLLTEFKVHPLDVDLPEGKMKRMLPEVSIIENHRYFRDGVSTPAVKPRIEGHVNVKDYDEMAKMPDIDKDALAAILADLDLNMLQRPDSTIGGKTDRPTRKEVLYYEVFIRECNDYRDPAVKPELQNGTIFSIAVGQHVSAGAGPRRVGQARYLRAPRAFFGPKEGPYQLIGGYDVPMQTYPISPVAVCMQQTEELNAHCTAAANAAARMKTLVFVDSAQDTLQSAVTNSPDGTCVGIPGIHDSQITTTVIGGPAKEQYDYIALLRARLDRNIGIDDAQRGELQQGVTAFATNIAAQTASVRIGELRRRFADGVQAVLQKVAWYAWESPNFILFLSPEDGQELGMKSPAFYGGPSNEPGEQHVPWDNASLTIQAYSLQPPDEQTIAQNTLDALAMVAQLAQEMSTAPWLGWDTILDRFSDVTKFDWLPEAINTKLFIAYQQQAQAQNEQVHAATMAESQLRLESLQLDNQLKKIDLITRMQALQAAGQQEQKGPSVSINYKDVPEDIKRVLEKESTGVSSSMPLTAPHHITNAKDLESQRATQQHQTTTQKADHKQQQTQSRQSMLAGMFKDFGKGKPAAGKGNGPSQGSKPLLKRPASEVRP